MAIMQNIHDDQKYHEALQEQEMLRLIPEDNRTDDQAVRLVELSVEIEDWELTHIPVSSMI